MRYVARKWKAKRKRKTAIKEVDQQHATAVDRIKSAEDAALKLQDLLDRVKAEKLGRSNTLSNPRSEK